MRTLTLLVLLLFASPAWAAPIVLTGGTIDITEQAHDVILIGPDLQFTGRLFQGFEGVFVTPGQPSRIGLNGPLVGTLTYQGQIYDVPLTCEQVAGPNCGSLFSIAGVFLPPGDLVGTAPFEQLTGQFRQGSAEVPHLTEPITFTGSGLLTATAHPLLNLHYEITAVPEPATWLLFTTGLLGLVLWRSKKGA